MHQDQGTLVSRREGAQLKQGEQGMRAGPLPDVIRFGAGPVAGHSEFDKRIKVRTVDLARSPVPDREGSIEDIHGHAGIPAEAGGVMDMRTRAPGKESSGSVAAKAVFARPDGEDVHIDFQYMFIEDPLGDAELVVYLSEKPEVGDELVEVARIRPPAAGRPGSVDSDKFTLFPQTSHEGILALRTRCT